MTQVNQPRGQSTVTALMGGEGASSIDIRPLKSLAFVCCVDRTMKSCTRWREKRREEYKREVNIEPSPISLLSLTHSPPHIHIHTHKYIPYCHNDPHRRHLCHQVHERHGPCLYVQPQRRMFIYLPQAHPKRRSPLTCTRFSSLFKIRLCPLHAPPVRRQIHQRIRHR